MKLKLNRSPQHRIKLRRIHLPQWFYYLLIFPFFKPALLGVMEETWAWWLENIFDLWRLGAAGLICVLYAARMIRWKRKPSPVVILLAVYLGFVALATVVRANNLWEIVNYAVTILCFCLLVELRVRAHPRKAVDMIVMPLTVLVVLNFVLELIFPLGVVTGGTYGYSYNLMGIDNLLSPLLIPYMFLVALRSELYHGRLNWFAYGMIWIAAESLLLVWSATGLMGMLLALVYLLFFHGRKGQALFNFPTAMAVGAVLFFGIVVFRLQNLLEWLITGVLHKGLSFTGRTDIWDEAIAMFLASPFLGYGLSRRGKVYRLRKGKYYHAHNLFLEILVEGGIGALIAYLAMLFFAGRKLMRHREHKYACLLSALLMTVMLMGAMEPFLDLNGLLIYGSFVLSYYVGRIIAAEPKATEESAETSTPSLGNKIPMETADPAAAAALAAAAEHAAEQDSAEQDSAEQDTAEQDENP